MRIIAVWSLFARWTPRVTESKGCSPLGLKNTSWPTGGLEIFSAERQRIPRSVTFIATSEQTLNFVYTQHESRASVAPQGDIEWQTYLKCRLCLFLKCIWQIRNMYDTCWNICMYRSTERGATDPFHSGEGVKNTGCRFESCEDWRRPRRVLARRWGNRCLARSHSRGAVKRCQAQPVTFWLHNRRKQPIRCAHASFRSK